MAPSSASGLSDPIVVALGGNAISRPGEEGNIKQQFQHTSETVEHLADLIALGRRIVITHGNGPQVGNVLRRVELSLGEVYPIPLHLCVANTQAGMGHMISQCLYNALVQRGIKRPVSVIITHVVVDENDPGFQNPDKPIGRKLPRERAEELASAHGWSMKPFGDGYRRVVASPQPREVLEKDLICRLVADGDLLVAGGGGGIAVRRSADGEYFGVDCVVDKDRTSALMAADLNAEAFVIATGVEKVMINFGKPDQRALDVMTCAEARKWMAEGQFPPGSMGPKIEAAIDYLEDSKRPDAKVIICDLAQVRDALEGRAGTIIQR